MSKLRTVLICLVVAASGACNSPKKELTGTDSMQWQFQSYSCAFGCDPLIDGILNQFGLLWNARITEKFY